MKDSFTVADDLLFNTVEKFKRLDKANVTDEQERTRYELKIYQSYFSTLARLVENPHSDGKKETAREYVGQHIHPGYTLMPDAIFLFANHAVLLPKVERNDCLSPFRELMLLIGVRWSDAELAALNVQARIDELMAVDIDTTKKISQAVADQLMVDFKRHEQALRDCLKVLAETLLNAPSARADEMLAAINAVGEKLDAVGADAKHAADNTDAIRAELADWRDWVKSIKNGSRNANPRTQPLCRPTADAVCKVWNDYKSGTADCEVPKKISKDRYRKVKRSFRECLEAHGADIVYHSKHTGHDYTLSELVPDADAFKRIVNAGRMRANRQPAPTRKRKNAQAAHKRSSK